MRNRLVPPCVLGRDLINKHVVRNAENGHKQRRRAKPEEHHKEADTFQWEHGKRPMMSMLPQLPQVQPIQRFHVADASAMRSHRPDGTMGMADASWQ